MLYLCLYYGLPPAILVALGKIFFTLANRGVGSYRVADSLGVSLLLTVAVMGVLALSHLKDLYGDRALIDDINERQELLVDICSHVESVTDQMEMETESIRTLNEKLAKHKEANRGPWDYFISDAVETTAPIRIISCNN